MVTKLAAPRRFAREYGFPIGAQHWVLELLEARTCLSAVDVTNTLATDSTTETPAQLVAQANNTFAINLFNQLSNENPSSNVFFSPYSISTAMEMVLQGANGATASEIIQALDLPSTDIANAGIEALYQLFQTNSATSGYTLSTANALWVQNNFPLLQSFLTTEQNVFGAGPQTVDFTDPQAAAQTIDTWVSNQTNGKIPDLITPDMIKPLTVLVLTNAIYFQGNWASAFNVNGTQATQFQESATESTTVQMMNQAGGFGYYAQSGANGFQAVDLPYQGNNLDMVVILPTDPNLADFQSTLTPALFSQITSNLAMSYISVALPRFQLNETYNLIPALENLGIQSAFNPAEADFR
jgi:serpin B